MGIHTERSDYFSGYSCNLVECWYPMWVPICVLASPLLIQVLANYFKNKMDDLHVWATVTHMKELDKISDSWCWPGPTLVLTVIWEVSQQKGGWSLSFSVSTCLSPLLCNFEFKINK